MKWKIISFLLLLSINCYGQKYVEIVSEIQDSMALLNQSDIDSINKIFHEHDVLDSLNTVNEQMIDILKIENAILDSILLEQRAIINNDSIIINQNKIDYDNQISSMKKEIKRESNKKLFYQGTTGISVLTIILILLL